MSEKLDNADKGIDPVRHAAIYAATKTGLFPALNSSLFRYVSMRGNDAWALLEKTVLESTLPLTTSNGLNDPFDSNPILVDDVTSEELSAFLDWASTKTNSQNFAPNKIKVTKPDGSLYSHAELDSYAAKVIQEQLVAGNKNENVASFSRRISSQLLWSHYANGYNGLAYHFVARGTPKSALLQVHSVHYDRQRPILFVSEMFDMFSATGTDNLTQPYLSFSRRAYLTKSIEWAYEEEERLLSKKKEAQFDERELVSIIAGPRFSDADLIQLKAIVAKRKRPLPIYRARISESDYAIEVEWSKGAI